MESVGCPAGFRAIWNDSARILRCRRDVVSWVVTTCTDKAFANYVVKRDADSCVPTEIPGVGTPPGVRDSISVSCAASCYELMTDCTGERDRCERIEQTFAMPLPAGRGMIPIPTNLRSDTCEVLVPATGEFRRCERPHTDHHREMNTALYIYRPRRMNVVATPYKRNRRNGQCSV